jgi:hypothetical protein
MLICLFLNILLLACASVIVFKILKIKSAIDSIIALFVVYFALIVFIELALGIAGLLYLKNVIYLSCLLFLVAYLLTRKKGFNLTDFSLAVYFKKLLSNKLFTFIFCVAASFAIVKILVNLLNPPFGWDSLNYHFTFSVEWLKHGNLNVPIVIFDDPSPTYYPLNGSLFYLWLILPFKSVFLADLGQLPFFVVAVVSVYGISRKLGLSRTYAFYSGALFTLIPNFFKQLQIAYVDVMVGSLFLACVNFLLLFKDKFNFTNTLIYGLSLGLLVGTKTVALPYGVLLIIPFLVILAKNYKRADLGLVVMFSILVFGGFSYFRNFIETGNPLYPLDFNLFNTHIFKGVMDRAVYNSHFARSDYSFAKMMFHEGLGAQSLLFVLPGVLLALPIAFLKRRKELDFTRVYILLLPILMYLVYRFVIPLGNLRYLYGLMGLGMVFGFYVAGILKINKLAVNVLVFICVLASFPELAKKQELISSVIFSVMLFVCLINLKWIKMRGRRITALILSGLLVFGLLLWAEVFYNANEFPRYSKMVKYSGFWPDAAKAWDWLNRNTSGNNIAYTGRAVPFPLYGSDFKNTVYYISVNKVQPAKLQYFNNSRYVYEPGFESLLATIEQDNNYRGKPDYTVWFENLRKANIDYLFVYSLQQTKSTIFPLEDSWAKSSADKFELLFNNNTIHIYRVIK